MPHSAATKNPVVTAVNLSATAPAELSGESGAPSRSCWVEAWIMHAPSRAYASEIPRWGLEILTLSLQKARPMRPARSTTRLVPVRGTKNRRRRLCEKPSTPSAPPTATKNAPGANRFASADRASVASPSESGQSAMV